jgi:hypothetical protein
LFYRLGQIIGYRDMCITRQGFQGRPAPAGTHKDRWAANAGCCPDIFQVIAYQVCVLQRGLESLADFVKQSPTRLAAATLRVDVVRTDEQAIDMSADP